MATLGATVPTLIDWAKRLDPNGSTAQIVEMLGQTNALLDDMPFVQGNLPTGHRTTIRTGLPAVYWRLMNQGVPPSKSTTAQVDEQCGLLEAWSEVDEELANLNGNISSFRLSEAQPFTEAMNQEMAQTVFYGNSSTAPEEFNGLSVRFSSLSAANAQNIIDAGGTGSDNTSIYLIGWGANTVTGIFPKGSKAGIEHKDWGHQINETTAGIGGNRMAVYRDQWKWKCGIAVNDWRYVVRIANIDISNLVANAGSQAALLTIMAKAVHRLPNLSMVKPVFYMNRTVGSMLDVQAMASVSSGGGITYENVSGKIIGDFRGIPVRTVDALLETEARVT